MEKVSSTPPPTVLNVPHPPPAQAKEEGGHRKPLCTEGMLIKGQWKISKQLGMGAFGEIYLATNVTSSEEVAVKVEVMDEKKQALRTEVIIMRRLQNCPYVGRFIACGRQENFNYLVMQLLGENLSEMRRRQALCTFSLPTVCRLAIEMVQALQSLHSYGIVHRDVKPSNFVLDRSFSSPDYSAYSEKRVYLYIIDFGLSRKYLDSNGEVRPPRQNAGFRGTARYASIYSHASKDLAPRDDLWSVFYLLIEFVVGSLPWSKIRDRDKIGEVKNQYFGNTKLVDKLPPEFAEFQRYLMTLDYFSVPDYAHIVHIFRGLLKKTTGQAALPPYEWESVRMRSTSQRIPPTAIRRPVAPPPPLAPAAATTATSKKKRAFNEESLDQLRRKSSMCEGAQNSSVRAPTTFAAHVMSSTAIASSEKRDGADSSSSSSSSSSTNENGGKVTGSKKEGERKKSRGIRKKKEDCVIA